MLDICIDSLLTQAQISYIETEVHNLQEQYGLSERDEVYQNIIDTYTAKAEQLESLFEQLEVYKNLYETCLNYVFTEFNGIKERNPTALTQAQIDYIKKEVYILYTKGLEAKELVIVDSYEAEIKKTKNLNKQLKLYRQMYLELLNNQDDGAQPQPVLVEQDLCGTEANLIVYDFEENEEGE